MAQTAEHQITFPVVSRPVCLFVLAVLSVQFLGLGLFEAWRDAPTFDEAFALSSGVTAATRHQLQVTSGHPPLPEFVAALPVLAAHPIIPYGENWRTGSVLYANDFLNANARAGTLRRVVFVGRLIPLLEAVIVGWLMFVLGGALFARSAGLLAAAAWLTMPLTLGLGHINGDDIPFTLVTLLLSLALLRYLRRRAPADVIALGLLCGVALLTRLIALTLVPAVAIVVLVAERRRLQHALVASAGVLAIAWGCVWVVVRAISPAPAYRHSILIQAPGPLQRAVRAALIVPWPLEFADNVRDQARVTKLPAPAFLLGHAWMGGRWWYWPATMLVKVPASTLLLILAGVVCWWGLDRMLVQRALVVLAVPAAAITMFVVPQPRQLGVRYLLPVIALALVASGPIVRMVGNARAPTRLAACAALGVLATAQLIWLWDATPHSLAWTAPPFRPGYQAATDSNLDWGQDLYALASWSRTKHPSVAYFGTVDPALLVEGTKLLPSAAPTGWVAVSASYLTAWESKQLSWLRAYCPVSTINGTILIYRFDQPPDLRPGPQRPANMCAGDLYSRRR